MRPGAGTMACLLRWGAEEMLAQGHVGSLLFKAAFRSFNSTSPLGPSGLILSIFSSAFVFLASEGGSPHLHDSVQLLVCIFLFFFFPGTQQVVWSGRKSFAIRKMDVCT